MIRFDLNVAEVPVNASKITKAELSLFAYSITGFPDAVVGEACTLYTVTKDWEELSTTWINTKTGVPWTLPGGDFSTVNPVVLKYALQGEWETYAVTEVVKQFITDPASNFGFLCIPGNCNKGRAYYSGNYAANPELRPKLTLEIDVSR